MNCTDLTNNNSANTGIAPRIAQNSGAVLSVAASIVSRSFRQLTSQNGWAAKIQHCARSAELIQSLAPLRDIRSPSNFFNACMTIGFDGLAQGALSDSTKLHQDFNQIALDRKSTRLNSSH